MSLTNSQLITSRTNCNGVFRSRRVLSFGKRSSSSRSGRRSRIPDAASSGEMFLFARCLSGCGARSAEVGGAGASSSCARATSASSASRSRSSRRTRVGHVSGVSGVSRSTSSGSRCSGQIGGIVCGVSRSCRRWRTTWTRSRKSSMRTGEGHRDGLHRSRHHHVTRVESEILQPGSNQDDSRLVEGGTRSFISRSFLT